MLVINSIAIQFQWYNVEFVQLALPHFCESGSGRGDDGGGSGGDTSSSSSSSGGIHEQLL